MTRTDLLSLAAQCPPEAAALLRKLAELRPVAWQTPEHYSPDVGSWFEYYDALRKINDTTGLTALYQLSEVLTDE